MSEGKGKARSTNIDDEKSVPSEALRDASSSNSSSILHRIGSSATNLGRSILSPPQPGSELNSLSASTSTAAGKGVPGSLNTGSALNEGSPTVFQSASTSIAGPTGNTIRRGNQGAHSAQAEAEFSNFVKPTDGLPLEYNSFHVGDTEAHVLQAEAEFSSILDSVKPLTLPADQLIPRLANQEYERTINHKHGAGLSRTVSDQEAIDGKDVSDLLCDPASYDLVNDTPRDEDREYWLKEELRISSLIQQNKPLKDTLLKEKPLIAFRNNLEQTQSKSEEMNVWYLFLTSYQDDVWGDIGPLVGEAREEIKSWAPEKGDLLQQPTAVRRLGLILGHIRQ